ncbi:unnamed protein product [Wickerhamomyces anomalus]
MIPFEGLLPYGIMMTVRGGLVTATRVYQNNGHRVRYAYDNWEEQMMERDYRLTGKFREQVANEKAPEIFKTNSFWKLEKPSRWW